METYRARQWVYERLSSDTGAGGVSTLTGGRIYRSGHVPSAAVSPYVEIGEVAASDIRELGQAILYVSVLLQVTVWGTGLAAGTLEAVADRLHLRLHKASGVTTGGTAMAVTRERIIPIAPRVEDDGKLWERVTMEVRAEMQ